ncbi:MAG TPA: hypothetical protein VFQ91_16635 [Bryobacteraceae bacterium]|nr:hypothetical protein [Bryobacteraceae bacterium]
MRTLRLLDFLPFLLLAAALLPGCGPSQSTAAEPPPQVHGGWTRDRMEEKTAADVPASLQSLHPNKVWRVTYKGPHDISGLWIQYPNETVAFEALQKTNKGPAIRPFYRGGLFVILDADGVPPQALGDFQEGVTKALP